MVKNGIEKGYKRVCVCHENPEELSSVSPLSASLCVPAAWLQEGEDGKLCVLRERLLEAGLKWQPREEGRGNWITPEGFQIPNGSYYRVLDELPKPERSLA